VKIRSFVHDPRVQRMHENMVAPDAKRARAAGLVDKGVRRAPTDRAFGLTSTEALRGIGSSTARKLQTLGIMTVSQLAHSVADLTSLGPQTA
jgi:predicted flap endonuclease-1-like 5' DNA nuclease